jgi:GTP pyrophosphokinase
MVKQDENLLTPEIWVATISKQRGEADVAMVSRALRLYEETGKPLLATNGIAIANMLLKLELDTDTILASLLYPAVKQQLIQSESISEHFGLSVSKLLHDCMQMQSLGKLKEISHYHTHQIENLRKMLLAMVTDIRAVLIILAERLGLLRLAKALPVPEQQKLAKETLDVYAPLANRIGVWQLKWEIEDLCLRYLNADAYTAIAKFLTTRRAERETYLQHVNEKVTEILTKGQISKFELSGRVKHIYSIYKKMERKNVPIEEIFDISALRVLVPTVADCYTVLSLFQAEYRHIPQEFDDYIAQPKPNGYQSIHTVIYGPEDRIIEVQIRTFDMHHTSELGAASHWRYKEGMSQQDAYEAKIALLRQIMGWQREVAKDDEVKREQPVQDIFADRIYAFTPQGDIIDLPHGATPLDFAYHVHSEVGHRCRGAKVDGKMVPLTHALQTGNRVEIMTAKQPNPSRDWLNAHFGYIKSGRARSVLAHWFRLKDNVNEKEIKKKLPPVVPVPALKKAFVEQHLETAKERSQAPGAVTGVDSLLSKLAKCCKPLPGDPIIGYVTQNRGVSIHRRNCSNITNLERNDTNRFMEVSWGKTVVGRYPVDLLLHAHEHSHLLRDITGALSNEDLQVAGIQTKLEEGAEVTVYVTVMITGVEELNKAIKVLQMVNQVQDVRRV